MLPCVCSVIDHRGRQNVVRTSVTHSAAPRVPLFCSYHILTSSVIYYWTDARQHGMYLLHRTHLKSNMIHPRHVPTFAHDCNRKSGREFFIQKVSGQLWQVRDEFWVPAEEFGPGKRELVFSLFKFSNLVTDYFTDVFIRLVIVSADVGETLWSEKHCVSIKYFILFSGFLIGIEKYLLHTPFLHCFIGLFIGYCFI